MISIKEMIAQMKKNVICNFPDDYTISSNLLDGFTEDDVRIGMKGFSSLLVQLYDVLHGMNNPITEEEATTNGLGLTNVYADIRKSLSLLYAMGVCGKSRDSGSSLLIEGGKLNELYKKMRCSKPLEYMHLLQDAGLVFSIDLSAKSLNLNKVGVIELQYPGKAIALVGLKALAEAVAKICRNAHGADVIYTFARCDYNALSLPKKYIYEIPLIAKFLPDDYRDFFVQMHSILLYNMCKCEAKINMNDYQFTYKPKKATANVCSINISFERSTVRINSRLIVQQPDFLANAPKGIRDAVKNGFTCLKKADPNACNPKCEGKNLSFTLDGEEHLKCWIINFILPVNEDNEHEFVMQWLEKELSFYSSST
ncbi:MAG: hypothetical protein FWC73_10045 [Defluviitaleaceae bacterium]|nr:hypothetical protein [Defluviitaleaceae bacterium]